MSLNTEIMDNLVATVDYYNHRIATPTWHISEDLIDFVDISYVVSGQAEYIINAKRYTVTAGDLICIPAGSRRQATTNPNSMVELYSINGQMRDLEGNNITLPFPIVSSIGLHKDITALYTELNTVWKLRDPGYLMRARAIYLMLLQRFFQLIILNRDTSMLDIRIKKVLHHIANHYHEPLTVQNMADMVNLSDMYFGNLFKKETGMSFRSFLTSIRINHAEEMLYSGEFKISEIAEACGFSDVFYFSRLFKENRGIAPSQAIRSRKTTT